MKRTFVAAFLLLFLTTPGQAGFDAGLAAYNKNDFSGALREWHPLAEGGNAEARYMLGRVYYRFYQDYDKAFKWFEKAGQQGHAASLYNLRGMYREGRGVTQNLAIAMKWHHMAAEKGDASAQNHLGFMYDFGRNVPQNFAEALKWYRKAAEQGHAIAQYNLGTMYSKGKGLPQDYIKAHKWFGPAAIQGNDLAGNDRNTIAKMMTDAQIVEAQKQSRSWITRQGKE